MPLYKPATHDLDGVFSECQKTDLPPLQRTTGGMPKRQMPRKALAGAEVLETREVMSATALGTINTTEAIIYQRAHELLEAETQEMREVRETELDQAEEIDLLDENEAVTTAEQRINTASQSRDNLSQAIATQEHIITNATQQESALGLQKGRTERSIQGLEKSIGDMTKTLESTNKQIATLQAYIRQYGILKTALERSRIELAAMQSELAKKKDQLQTNPYDRSLALQVGSLEMSISIKTRDHTALSTVLAPQIAALLPAMNRINNELPRALSLQKNIQLQLPVATRILKAQQRTWQSIDHTINASTVVRQTAEHTKAGFTAQLAVLDQVFAALSAELDAANTILDREKSEIDDIVQLTQMEHALGIPAIDVTHFSPDEAFANWHDVRDAFSKTRNEYAHSDSDLQSFMSEGAAAEERLQALLSQDPSTLSDYEKDLIAALQGTSEKTELLEPVTIVPTMEYHANVGDEMISINWNDMPAGVTVTLTYREGDRDRQFASRTITGTGTAKFQLVPFNFTIPCHVWISDTTGKRILLHEFDAYRSYSVNKGGHAQGPMPEFAWIQHRSVEPPRSLEEITSDQNTASNRRQAASEYLSILLERYPGFEELVPLLQQYEEQCSTIDDLSLWNPTEGMSRLTELQERSGDLTRISSNVIALSRACTDALASADPSFLPALEKLQRDIQIEALRLTAIIDQWKERYEELWHEGSQRLSPDLAATLMTSASADAVSLVTSDIDLASSTEQSASESMVTRTVYIPDLGGAVHIKGLHGSSDSALAMSLESIESESSITETGKAMVLDFTQLTSTIHHISFKATSSLETDLLKISFLHGGRVVETQIVLSGSQVEYENGEGIHGVLIENATDHMSADAREFYEYRRMYTSPYMNFDPGPEHEFFGSRVRPDLAPRRAAIVAEANRGDLSHPLTLSNLSLTGNVSSLTETGPALSSQSAGLFAKMNLPRLDTVAPIDHWQQFSVPYDKNSYNEYQLLKYRDNPTLRGVFYRSPNGNMQQLPRAFFEMRGEILIVYPTGQDLQIFLDVEGGYRGAYTRNFDVQQKTGETLAETLPSEGKHLSIGGTTTYNVNDGGEGWSAETSTGETSYRAPNTAGSVKIGAYFANDGTVPLNITVHAYAGHEGSSGWDTPLLTYTTSLGIGEVRKLVTSPIANSGGYLRLIAFDENGTKLSETGRTISAPTMNEGDQAARVASIQEAQRQAIAQGQEEARQYLVANGFPVPATGSGSTDQISQVVVTHDPAAAERVLRTAFKALASAKESGDPVRIALEESRFTVATSGYQVALGTLDTAEKIENTRSVVTILEEERVQEVALSQTQGGRLHSASKVLDMQVDSLVRVASAGTIDNLSNVGSTISNRNDSDHPTLDGLSTDPSLFSDLHSLIPRGLQEIRRKISWKAANSWYNQPTNSPNAAIDTALERVLLGAKQQLSSLGNVPDTDPFLVSIIRSLSSVTGIRPSRFSDSDGFLTLLPTTDGSRTLWFNEAHFASFFETAQLGFALRHMNSSMPLDERLGPIHIGTKREFESDEEIQLRFDAPLDYRNATLSLVDESAPLSSSPTVLQNGISHRFFTKVSVAHALEVLGKESAHVRFRLEFTQDNGQKITTETEYGVLLRPKLTMALSTNPDPVMAKKEDEILTQIVKNFPLENPVSRYQLLGSGYHDGNEYYSADINSLDGGDTDRGDSIYAVADGILRIGNYTGNVQSDLNTGAVTIDHTAMINSQNIAWQSAYLHLPIFDTGRTEIVDVSINGEILKQERRIYEVHHQKTVNHVIQTSSYFIKIWDGKHIIAKDIIGFEGGRTKLNADGTYDEGLENAHVHFFIKINGVSIDLRKTLYAAGMKVIKAYDGGADNNAGTIEDNTTRVVEWNININAYANINEKIVLDRTDQKPLTPKVLTSEHWLAWEDGIEVQDMQRVVWDTDKKAWYKFNSETRLRVRDTEEKLLRWMKKDDIFQFISE